MTERLRGLFRDLVESRLERRRLLEPVQSPPQGPSPSAAPVFQEQGST